MRLAAMTPRSRDLGGCRQDVRLRYASRVEIGGKIVGVVTATLVASTCACNCRALVSRGMGVELRHPVGTTVQGARGVVASFGGAPASDGRLVAVPPVTLFFDPTPFRHGEKVRVDICACDFAPVTIDAVVTRDVVVDDNFCGGFSTPDDHLTPNFVDLVPQSGACADACVGAKDGG